jgi:hypothetical protein
MSDTMTAEEERRIADYVYPLESDPPGHRKWRVSIDYGGICPHSLRIVGETEVWIIDDLGEFNPSLTGSDREKAQALDCIVAATRNSRFRSLIRDDNGTYDILTRKLIDLDVPQFLKDKYVHGPDILTASLQAILSYIGEG